MWDKATFPSNKGIFETKAQRLGTKYMLYVSLLLIRDKGDRGRSRASQTRS